MTTTNTPSSPASSPRPTTGHDTRWEIGEALGVGVKGVREHWRVLVPASLVVMFLTEGLSQLMGQAGESLGGAAEQTLSVGSVGISLVLGAVLSAGLMQITLDTARGKQPRLSSLLGNAGRALPMIATYILMCAAVMAGTVAFIIPGLILALGLSFAPMLVVDRKLGAVDALKQSWTMMSGHKLMLLGFSLVCGGIALVFMVPGMMLGMAMAPLLAALAMIVPVFVISVVAGVAQAWIYLRVSGELPGQS